MTARIVGALGVGLMVVAIVTGMRFGGGTIPPAGQALTVYPYISGALGLLLLGMWWWMRQRQRGAL